MWQQFDIAAKYVDLGCPPKYNLYLYLFRYSGSIFIMFSIAASNKLTGTNISFQQ